MEGSLKESFSSGPGKALERKLLRPRGQTICWNFSLFPTATVGFFVYLQSAGCVSGGVSWQSILRGKTKKVSVTDRGWHVPLQILSEKRGVSRGQGHLERPSTLLSCLELPSIRAAKIFWEYIWKHGPLYPRSSPRLTAEWSKSKLVPLPQRRQGSEVNVRNSSLPSCPCTHG